MPHFFINSNQKQDNIIRISDRENYNHIAKSLRARVGEDIKLCDELEMIYKCKIQAISKYEIIAEIKSSERSFRKLPFNLSIAQSPLRSDAQLTLVEKVTELGVKDIYPIHTDFCALAKNVAEQKVEKWQKTMYEASKQCERANIPECKNLTKLSDLPYSNFDKIIVFAERDSQMSLRRYVEENSIEENSKILVIIGPEGGFSQAEFDWFEAQKFALVSLGNLILKAETAAIIGIGNLIYGYSK